jgi:hypothetical protein
VVIVVVVVAVVVVALLTKYYSGDRINQTERSRTYSTYGGYERCIQNFGGET